MLLPSTLAFQDEITLKSLILILYRGIDFENFENSSTANPKSTFFFFQTKCIL